MIYAELNSKRIKAEPNQRAKCPFCGNEVTSVCGQYVVNHWRHTKESNCDSWSEGETDWHLKWKSYFPEDWREVILYGIDNNERHIADIRTNTSLVIEFQNSPIVHAELQKRIDFYGKMIWVINANNFGFIKEPFLNSLRIRYNSNIAEFKYSGRSKIFHKWIQASVPVFFDFDEPYLFWLKTYHFSKEGTMQLVKREEFLNKYLGR